MRLPLVLTLLHGPQRKTKRNYSNDFVLSIFWVLAVEGDRLFFCLVVGVLSEEGKMNFTISPALVTSDPKDHLDHPSPPPFPTRLFTMLEESQRRGFEDVISWQPGGESFRVHKADRFAAEIAGDFFALRKYKSFLRQLNIYGFQRIHHGPNKGGYCHVHFKRENPDGVRLLCRQGESQRPSNAVAISPGIESQLQLARSSSLPSNESAEISASTTQEGMYSQTLPAHDTDFDPVEILFSLGSPRLSLQSLEQVPPPSVSDSSDITAASSTNETVSGNALQGGGRDQVEHSFPWKLHILLEEAEREGFTAVISWVQGGTAFRVHDSETFVSCLMPNYFDQSKYESFRRQLNLYGFARVTRGVNKGFISHPCFIRSNRNLCRNIIRKGKEEGSTKEAYNEAYSPLPG